MKKIILIISVLILTVRCEETLEEIPKSFLTKENFYTNASDANAAVIAVYSIMSEESGGRSFPSIWFMSLLENRAEHSDGRGSQAPVSFYDQPLDGTNQNRAFGVYNELFRGINFANTVLANVPDISMDENLKMQYLAEAKFLRAFYYSNLVKYWAGVPIRTEEFTDLSQVGAPRAPVSAVWDLIVSDLIAAIPDLPESYGDSESGRATSWAAKMVLADSYLNIENWTEARDLADEVISSGTFALMPINQPDDFLQMFGPEVITYPEDIWSMHFSETNGNFIATFIHRFGFGFSVSGFFAWLPVTTSYIGSWDTNDLRQQFNLYEYVINAPGDTMFLPEPFPLFKKYQDPGASSATGNRNNIPVHRLAEAYLIYAEAASQAEGGPSASALERLNTIRRRGYGLDPFSPSAVDYLSGMSQEVFRETVIQERAYEFVLEMKRWNDLLRTGTAQEKVEASGRAWSDVSLLFPIPLDEINNNPEMSSADQNPGY